MKAGLAKRVKRLEIEMNLLPKFWVTISKLSIPDQEVCREMGKRNVSAVKLMRSARIAGISFRKVVEKGSVCPDDFCEWGPNMVYEDLLLLTECYRQER